jgi:hypothetical protein
VEIGELADQGCIGQVIQAAGLIRTDQRQDPVPMAVKYKEIVHSVGVQVDFAELA